MTAFTDLVRHDHPADADDRRHILEVLEAHRGCLDPQRFAPEIGAAKSFELARALSPRRAGVFGWRDLADRAHVLDLNPGFGEHVEDALRRGARVTAAADDRSRVALRARLSPQALRNVTMIDPDRLTQELEPDVDLVVLDGIPELVGSGRGASRALEAMLADVRRSMKADAELLWVHRNRFGLDAMAGARYEGDTAPFEGLQPYRGQGIRLSRLDGAGLLARAGFAGVRTLYALPNHELPEYWISEGVDPTDEILSRITWYLADRDGTIAWPADVVRQVARHGALDFMANGFLHIAVPHDQRTEGPTAVGSTTVRAFDVRPRMITLSTDRAPDRAFVTVVRGDDIVTKRAAFPEGHQRIARILEHHDHLRARGLHVVAGSLDGQSLVMPRITTTVLADWLAAVTPGSKARQVVLGVFDMIAKAIMASSDVAEVFSRSSEPRELPHGPNGWDPSAVLDRAFLDMVPYNAFWDGTRLTWFDQEFAEPMCPAGYVMFRAVYYAYVAVPGLSAIVERAEMADRYGLDHDWESHERRESRFIDQNRQRHAAAAFERWSLPDRERIDMARTRLSGTR